MPTSTRQRYTFDDLLDIMERLLDPGGCPWDRRQSLQSLKSFLLEETYEVLEAIDEGNPDHHREELGDLLFQVVFQTALRAREGLFSMDEVVSGIARKLVRRHPHVFGDGQAETPEQVRQSWSELKRQEAARRGERRRTLDGVPAQLPALLRAQRLQQKAAGVGFDWQEPAGARDKVREELEELDDAVDRADPEALRHECGDLLMAVVNLTRWLGVDAEDALAAANRRFERRFRHMEDRLVGAGRDLREASLDELESLWQEAKQKEDPGG
jgi:MazG family protein